MVTKDYLTNDMLATISLGRSSNTCIGEVAIEGLQISLGVGKYSTVG